MKTVIIKRSELKNYWDNRNNVLNTNEKVNPLSDEELFPLVQLLSKVLAE